MSFLSVQWKENLPAFSPYDTHNKTRLEVAISYKSLYKIEACMLTCDVLSHPSLQCTTTEVRHLSTASAILTAPARMTWKLVLYVRTAWLKCSIYAAVKKNHMKFLTWLLRHFFNITAPRRRKAFKLGSYRLLDPKFKTFSRLFSKTIISFSRLEVIK